MPSATKKMNTSRGVPGSSPAKPKTWRIAFRSSMALLLLPLAGTSRFTSTAWPSPDSVTFGPGDWEPSTSVLILRVSAAILARSAPVIPVVR